MNCLLDTHALLWFLDGDSRLSSTARQIIEDLDSSMWASIASLWEIAIKLSIGKLHLTQPFDALQNELDRNVIGLLPLVFEHTNRVSDQPFHHRDPFDRILIAQAMTENLVVIGRDASFDAYGIKRL